MNGIIFILFSIIFIAFFSGMEIAFLKSDKLRIELDLKHGALGSEIVRIFNDYPAQYISTMLTGRILSLVIYGLAFSVTFGPILLAITHNGIIALLLTMIISIVIILLIAEFPIKTIFLISPNFFLNLLAVPALFFFLLFYPFIRITVGLSNSLLKLFMRNGPDAKITEDMIFSNIDPDNLETIINQGKQDSEPEGQNIRIFRNALDFSNVKLREIMVPRTEIEAVSNASGVDYLREKFIATRFSRILVYLDSIDNITGYVEVKDIFKNPEDIKPLVRKLAIVPETMSADRLLKMFVNEKRNIALVVDEFGGTSGMVTIEDLLEEIVGDIEDEHDKSDLIEKVVRQNEFIFSGRLEIDYLNERYNLNLPEGDDYETLAGMILYHHGSIPGNNDVIRIGNIAVKILRASTTRIELVNMRME